MDLNVAFLNFSTFLLNIFDTRRVVVFDLLIIYVVICPLCRRL